VQRNEPKLPASQQLRLFPEGNAWHIHCLILETNFCWISRLRVVIWRYCLERTLIVKTQKLLLAATLLLTLLPSMAAAQSADTEVTSLNNKDVLLMVEKKVDTETIIKTIKSSPCTFDTFPPLLKEMKRRGVPESVLLAMVEAPYGPSVANSSKDDLGEQPIYHYAEQLKQMGFLTPTPSSRGGLPAMARGRSRNSSRTPIE
jgi:hypothetical protein